MVLNINCYGCLFNFIISVFSSGLSIKRTTLPKLQAFVSSSDVVMLHLM